jgi:lysophospholipase L1-like esterase
MALRPLPRLLLTAFLALPAFSPVVAHAELRPGDTIAICGDSITEQKLYSVFMENYFLMCQPAPNLKAHQFGWSGESVGGLVGRMKHAVLPFSPTVATTCYGMNDGGYAPIDAGRQQRYRDGTTTIVRTFKEAGVHTIVVGSPGIVDTDTFDKKANKKYPAKDYNEQTLANLSHIAKEVASAEGVAYADLHSVFTDVMAKAKAKYGSDYHVAGGDGIHPAANGHLIMAYAFLKALGCDGAIGTLTVDISAGQATATNGHKVLSYANGVLELESTRYPFCFTGAPTDPNGTRGLLEFLPFNDELNRYLLVVKNAHVGSRYKITWGTKSKVFTDAQLAQGINLAAEFLDNPFSTPFQQVENAIKAQQTFETPATKSILHNLPGWQVVLGDEKAVLDDVRAAVLRRSEKLTTAARAAVQPVTHRIQIEPAS